MEVFGDYTEDDFIFIYRIVLVFYILFGTLVLKLLISEKEKFIKNDKRILITFVVFLIIFIGTRKYDIGTDTSNYFNFYFIKITTQARSYFEIFTILKSDFLFEVIASFSFWHRNFTIFLLLVAAVMNISLYIFIRKFTDYGKEGSSLILFLTLASSFSFLSMEINIIRNGLSMCFILLALYSILERETMKFIFYFVVAYLLHRTAIIPIVLFLIINYFDRIEVKYYIAFYALAILLSLVGFGFHAIPYLSTLGNEDLQNLSYVGDTTYKIGFRFDFVLYNTFFLVLFLKFTNWNYRDSFLIKYYILSSSVFFFNFYIPFSDRFGIYSWIVIPLLLFNTINETFPTKKIYISTLVLIGFFILNNIILFP
ncbi:EpsG family protein [Tamlana sp. s12]|uniref:EpsG family protein n=1 Tax=Tamlana sp. s12 TaxID=1630406 RepID=UPI0007FD4404|nr:EpsG family protein [Tamlana sp. s12]OBQ54106.1 hypothetical protein VQ01_11660 [Tamlana sp. s12]QQY81383.1 EpsG family protein [Tamlana sp. s12]